MKYAPENKTAEMALLGETRALILGRLLQAEMMMQQAKTYVDCIDDNDVYGDCGSICISKAIFLLHSALHHAEKGEALEEIVEKQFDAEVLNNNGTPPASA